MSRPVVTLLGRPNVGKSSLFNRLLGRRKALVQDEPGVTRDRNYAIAELGGRELILCDTGGFEERGVVAEGQMARLIRQQALAALQDSDVLVFVMDIREGLTPGDQEIAQRLRSASVPVVWVLNKCDHESVVAQSADFYRLGVADFVLVSAEHGLGADALVEAIESALPESGAELGAVPAPALRPKPSRKGGRLHFLGTDMPHEEVTRRGPEPEEWDPRKPEPIEEPADDLLHAGGSFDDDGVEVHYVGWDPALAHAEEEELPPDFQAPRDDASFVPRVALLGRPNVGKSTLLNQLLGYQRSITSPVAGTTHDIVDAYVEHDGQGHVFIDTAGIRRKSRVERGVEALTVGRSIRTIEAAHICLLLVDGSEGVTDQEAKIGALIADRGRALVVVVNKWDLQRGRGPEPRQELLWQVRRRFPHLSFADSVFLSAKTGRGLGRLWHAIARANEGHRMTIGTGELNRWARGVWAANPPPMHKHRPVRLYYCAQTAVRPPTFVFFCNQPQALADSYKRYLANQLRAAFPAPGTPLRLEFRDREGEKR